MTKTEPQISDEPGFGADNGLIAGKDPKSLFQEFCIYDCCVKGSKAISKTATNPGTHLNPVQFLSQNCWIWSPVTWPHGTKKNGASDQVFCRHSYTLRGLYVERIGPIGLVAPCTGLMLYYLGLTPSTMDETALRKELRVRGPISSYLAFTRL